MTVVMVEPKKPGIPILCIWKCWCRKTSKPVSWEGRWIAYKKAQDSWYDHIRKDHYKGQVWPGSEVTVDDLLMIREKRSNKGKRIIRVKKQKGGW